MRIARFVVASSVLTCVCLLYVYQQTEIFSLAYRGHKQVVHMEDLLDKNTVLRYNIKKSGSLIYIGNKISQAAEFEMPVTYQMMTLAYRAKSSASGGVSAGTKKVGMLSRVFDIKSQAEANPVYPGQAKKFQTSRR